MDNIQSTSSSIDNSNDRIPLVALSDSCPAWIDGVPWIPHVSEFQSSGKINGNQHFGDFILLDNCGNIESLDHLEKLKINVIRGSVIKDDLTYGDFKLLGCSSLGLVTGKLIKKNL